MDKNDKLLEVYQNSILNEGRNEIQKKLREASASIAKEKIDKKDKNKIMGYIRDAINLLNKTTGF